MFTSSEDRKIRDQVWQCTVNKGERFRIMFLVASNLRDARSLFEKRREMSKHASVQLSLICQHQTSQFLPSFVINT
ncbi:CLUMA_CG016791, isoform A [Clunio marinus]|uniref:CLUMA_CG016791, isoform A n=1 Tax=Clunio marinus TaxID=568069 RepID=A0A1J1IUC0_9DIPT|nr:CLUMA_CG016791, isoform A [Clunio marinus]